MAPVAGSAGRARRVGWRRRGAVARAAGVAPLEVVRLVVVLRRVVVEAFRVLVAARFPVVVARRRGVAARVLVPLPICLACLVRPSIRFSTLLTSARVLAHLTCVCSVVISFRAFLSPSFTLSSTCFLRSAGARRPAPFRARRPA